VSRNVRNRIKGSGVTPLSPRKEGLSNNDMTTILEDKTGKFWFGTRGYLSVYDGKTFTTLTNEDGKGFKNV